MSELVFRVEVTATGEVRDKDGNLISSEPYTGTKEVTATQLREMGLPVPPHPDEGK
jgi:hypothetical protein